MKKEERKEYLKTLGYNKEEMKEFWEECLELEIPSIVALHKAGCTWKDLTKDQMKQLPYLKEKWLENNHKEIIENKQIEEVKSLSEEETLYNRLCKKDDFTEEELQELVWGEYVIEEIEGCDNRWTKDMESILLVNGHYFSIPWQKGLTECQDNSFYNKPYEVKPIEKIIKTTEYVEVDKEIENQASYMEIPCQIGDKVWVVNSMSVNDWVVTGFRIEQNNSLVLIKKDNSQTYSFPFSDWRVNVFPEKEYEKAQQRFQELESDYDEDLDY